MNFSVFDDIAFVYKDDLLQYCKKAECRIRTDPKGSFSNLRAALEALLKGLLEEHQATLSSREQMSFIYCSVVKCFATEDKEGNPLTPLIPPAPVGISAGLTAALQTPILKKISDADFSRDQCSLAHAVRMLCNRAEHYKDPSEKVIFKDMSISAENLQAAYAGSCILFHLMLSLFPHEGASFKNERIPFEDYSIVRTMEKTEQERILQSETHNTNFNQENFNYFVRKENHCYYVQILSADADPLLLKRSKLVEGLLAEQIRRPIPGGETRFTDETSQFRYIFYDVYPTSKLLSEMKLPLPALDSVKIIRSLLELLIAMKTKIPGGLHHRNLRPECLIVTPDGDDYYVNPVHMETIKAAASRDLTVKQVLIDSYVQNPYIPRELEYCDRKQEPDWEKVDVFSCAAVLAHCVCPQFLKRPGDPGPLYEVLPEDLVEFLMEIMDSSLSQVCTLEEFLDTLNNMLTNWEDFE